MNMRHIYTALFKIRVTFHCNLVLGQWHTCTLDSRLEMVEFCHFSKISVSEIFVGTKLHKIRSIYIYIVYFKKLLQFWGQYPSTALVQCNIWHKKCLFNVVLENLPQNRDNFLIK